MPGCGFVAKCPCGFSVKEMMAGATLDHHYEVVFCDPCKIMKSLFVSSNSERKLYCKKCSGPLLRIADYEYWIPKDLQKDHDPFDPWLIEDERAGEIRYRCPARKQFTLEIFEAGLIWD